MKIDFLKRKTFLTTVTPEDAKWLLNYHKVKMRPIDWGNVDRLAEKMKNGTWNPKSDRGISFRHTGVLVDGQHRLNAIIKAGIPVEIKINTFADYELLMQKHR